MSSFIEEDSDERINARSKTFINWMNSTIGKQVSEDDDPFEKLSNGVLLIKLLQSLAPGKKMTGRYRFQSFDNNNIIINQFLDTTLYRLLRNRKCKI